MDSDAARCWADRKGTNIKLKPPGNIGASTVERHHELLRDHLHKIDGAVKEEGLPGIEDRHVLQEAILAKNILLNTHGVSPYLALYGRHSRIMKDFENPTASEVHEGGSTASMRLREIAVAMLMEATAHDRLRRALRSKAGTPGEQLH